MYPRVKIELKKIEHNTRIITELCNKHNIAVTGVTKVFGADNNIVEMLIKGGISCLADSRIQNLKKMQNFNLEKILLRIPMQSELDDVIKYSDYSLNSEITTIKLLNKAACKAGKIHKIILMIDVGDLREGIWFKDKDTIQNCVKTVLDSKNLQLTGIGCNLACFGGVMVSKENMSILVETAEFIEKKFNILMDIISGGNSSSIHLLDILSDRINNLRLGEALVLGRETAFGKQIPGTYSDSFTLETEIVELYKKPTKPFGRIGMNAFGEVPVFEDRGIVIRGLLAIGKQDINLDSIYPFDNNIVILGASSDHLVVEVKNDKYRVGDIITFGLTYEGVLHSMNSGYIAKKYIC